MKRILLALTIFAPACACLLALSNTASQARQKLQAHQVVWLTQTEELAEFQAEQAALATKIRMLKRELRSREATAPMDPALVDLLLTNGIQSASLEMQDQILARFGWGENSSNGYVLVSKAALTDSTLKPLKTFPQSEKITDTVRAVLAVTPEEQQSVEAAFSEAFGLVAAWAKANVQREGPSEDMLVGYTIPADATFQQALINKLFSTINAAVGDERGELMRKFFEYWRISEDGAIGERTNILSIHRLAEPPGLGYRSGWKWANSETINTFPAPINSKNFPYAFFFLFPGGWPEVAQREGFDLPAEFNQKP